MTPLQIECKEACALVGDDFYMVDTECVCKRLEEMDIEELMMVPVDTYEEVKPDWGNCQPVNFRR